MVNPQPTEAHQKYLVKDDTPIQYFAMIPYLLDDSKHSATEIRLYLHLKRVAGENGSCWKGIRQIAEHCQLSTKTVVEAKKRLLEAGFIKVEKIVLQGHPAHVITITDIWKKNYEAYAKNNNELIVKSTTSSCENLKRKNNPIKNNPLNNNNGFTEIFEFFNENYSQRLTPHVTEQLKQLNENYPPGWALEAAKLAAEVDKFTIGYMKGILKDWQQRGFKAPKPQPAHHLANYRGRSPADKNMPKKWPGQGDVLKIGKSPATGKVIGSGFNSF